MTRTALVTGVCGGLGHAIAARFVTEGWSVVGIDIHEPTEPLAGLLDEFIVSDIAGDGQVAAVARQLGPMQSLTALVNNAAVQVNKSVLQTTDDEWGLVMDTNLRAAFQMIREFHDQLAATRGAIVNVSSVHALATSSNVAAYAVSKGALAALTRSVAVELAEVGVRCNAVLPGALDTPMLRAGLRRRPHPSGVFDNLDELVSRIPIGFVASPEQVAPTIVHLADSEQSPYITGQSIVIDGGATIKLSTE